MHPAAHGAWTWLNCVIWKSLPVTGCTMEWSILCDSCCVATCSLVASMTIRTVLWPCWVKIKYQLWLWSLPRLYPTDFRPLPGRIRRLCLSNSKCFKEKKTLNDFLCCSQCQSCCWVTFTEDYPSRSLCPLIHLSLLFCTVGLNLTLPAVMSIDSFCPT